MADVRYYTLLVRENKGPYALEFGAYDRSDVVSERNDWVDHYHDNGRKRAMADTRILGWDHLPTHDETVLKINQLNAELAL